MSFKVPTHNLRIHTRCEENISIRDNKYVSDSASMS